MKSENSFGDAKQPCLRPMLHIKLYVLPSFVLTQAVTLSYMPFMTFKSLPFKPMADRECQSLSLCTESRLF